MIYDVCYVNNVDLLKGCTAYLEKHDLIHAERFAGMTDKTRDPPTRTCCVYDRSGYSCEMLRCCCYDMYHSVDYLYVSVMYLDVVKTDYIFVENMSRNGDYFYRFVQY